MTTNNGSSALVVRKRLPAERVTIDRAIEYEDSFQRISVMGVLVGKNGEQFILDDGTGKILVRVFSESSVSFGARKVGDIVRVIGKLAGSGESKVLAAELVNAVKDSRWVKVHLAQANKVLSKTQKPFSAEKDTPKKDSSAVYGPAEQVIEFLRKNDYGEGVEMSELSRSITIEGFDEIVSSLISDGNVFEIVPGRIKLLE